MRLITILLLTFISLNASANFDSFKNTFNKLLVDDPWSGEFTLEYSYFTQDEDGFNETAPIISHIMHEEFVEGLLSMNLVQTFDVKETLKAFGSDSKYFGSDFYCYRLVKNFDSATNADKKCHAQLEKLLNAAFKDKGTDSVSVLKLSGDYYGDWETIYLILQNYDSNESLIVEFDILHEI